MENHWTQSCDWEANSQADPEPPTGKDNNNDTTPGNYHCKSALRSHADNMKLFLYKRDFSRLRSSVGGDPYDDQYTSFLPKLWRCFFLKTTGLDGTYDTRLSRSHSTPSLAVTRWADLILPDIVGGYEILEALRTETFLWPSSVSVTKSFYANHKKIIDPINRLLYLSTFLHMSLVVLNYSPNPNRPDITVALPGIITEVEEGIYLCTYNEFLSFVMCSNAVKVKAPGYEQIWQKDLYLNLCDKVFERMNVMIGSKLIESLIPPGSNDHPDSDLSDYVSRIIVEGDDILLKHGNRGYEILGKYEAYCTSLILTYDDPDIWDPKEFLNNLLRDDEINNPDLYPSVLKLVDTLKQGSVQKFAEVHGLWRIWGHPIIDLTGGLHKMEATCLKQPNVDNRETMICMRTFKLTFFTSYHRKHHHYPMSSCTKEELFNLYRTHTQPRDIIEYEANKGVLTADSYLFRCLSNDKEINSRSPIYNHSDWDKVVILQSFQIPRSINLATMIKDRAISMTRSELTESIQTKNSVFDPLKRRGILRWLESQTLKIYNFLMKIDNDGLDEDSRIIGLYPKERELKTKARFFSLMSYNMRMYVTATEEILGKYILKYFPMITMSDNLLSMIIRLFDMTTGIGDSGDSITYSMNIDFSKWNQNMRERTNAPVFECLDRIVGFRRLISRTHDIFRNSYLYLCSGEYVPSLVRGVLTTHSPYSRIGDESGKEGLRQKGWTITTVCDILSLAFAYRVKIELIGGGDNQVLTVTVSPTLNERSKPRTEQLRAMRGRMDAFRNALAKKMEKRGLPLKLEETWISHSLLMYNKIMYYKGVPLQGRLKVISRTFSNSNVGVTSLGNILSTLGTGYQSLSAKDYTPVLSWLFSRYCTFIYISQFHLCNPISGTRRLDRQILLSKDNISKGVTIFGVAEEDLQIKRMKEKIKFICTSSLTVRDLYFIALYYHKILGGPGIGPPTSYIMKGFPDPLSEALTFNYKCIQSAATRSTRNSIICLTRVQSSRVMHWEHLLEDPVSINHDAPAHGVAALRSQAEKIVRDADIKNVEFKKLLKLGDNQYLRALSEELCRPRELEPRLLHDIVGATLPGYVNTIVSRVDQSSTLNKIAGDHEVVNKIYESEVFYYIYLSDKIRVESGHVLGTCPTSDARNLRNSTWGKKIIGVTTPHPSAFLRMEKHTSTSPLCDQSYVMVHVNRLERATNITRGPFRPYFGSYTEEKFKTNILASAYGDEDVLARALKIQKLLGWRYERGTAMFSLIQKVLSCVTDADPDKFVPVNEEITGDVEHRYNDMATKHGGIPANLIHLYTYASCNTSTFIGHSKGASNESLHFQAVIIYSCMNALLDGLNDNKSTSIYHFHEGCNNCIKKIEVPSGEHVFSANTTLISCPTNDLMYVREDEIPIHYHNVINFRKDQEKSDAHPEIKSVDLKEEINKDRTHASWILLLSSMMITKTKIKTSTWKLISDGLSANEVITILEFIIIYHCTLTTVPLNAFDILSMRKLVEEFIDQIKDLLTVPSLTDWLQEQNIIIKMEENVDDVTELWYNIRSSLNTRPMEGLQGAYVKYQDPLMTPSRYILLHIKNPSCTTCSYCLGQIQSCALKAGPTTTCHLHGSLKTDMSYHLFSFDKLTKILKDLPTEGADQCLVGSKRKRNIGSLQEMLERSVLSKRSRDSRTRRSGILFDNEGMGNLLHIESATWTRYNITRNEDSDITVDDLKKDMIVRTDQGVHIPREVEYFIETSRCLYQVLNHARTNHHSVGLSSGNLRITIFNTITSADVPLIVRVLILVNYMLSKDRAPQKPIKIKLSWVPWGYKNLETAPLRLSSAIKDMYYDKVGTQARLLELADHGELSFDLFHMMDHTDVAISWSCGVLAEVNHQPTYILTTCSTLMAQLSHLHEVIESGKHLRCDLLLPQYRYSTESPLILYTRQSYVVKHICLEMVVNAITCRNMRLDTRLQSAIMTSLPNKFCTTLTQGVYVDIIKSPIPIVNRTTMDAVFSKLSTALSLSILQDDSRAEFSWRSITIIRLIIGLHCITHTMRMEATRYYTSFSNVAVKADEGNYLVLSGGRANLSQETLINRTKGVLGKKLLDTINELNGFIHIQYKQSGGFSNKIHLRM
nr:MAG: RNA-dependent RNA polymerase [Taraxacum betanucleorhabdovirus 1]